jgi:hypothetical protein
VTVSVSTVRIWTISSSRGRGEGGRGGIWVGGGGGGGRSGSRGAGGAGEGGAELIAGFLEGLQPGGQGQFRGPSFLLELETGEFEAGEDLVEVVLGEADLFGGDGVLAAGEGESLALLGEFQLDASVSGLEAGRAGGGRSVAGPFQGSEPDLAGLVDRMDGAFEFLADAAEAFVGFLQQAPGFLAEAVEDSERGFGGGDGGAERLDGVPEFVDEEDGPGRGVGEAGPGANGAVEVLLAEAGGVDGGEFVEVGFEGADEGLEDEAVFEGFGDGGGRGEVGGGAAGAAGGQAEFRAGLGEAGLERGCRVRGRGGDGVGGRGGGRAAGEERNRAAGGLGRKRTRDRDRGEQEHEGERGEGESPWASHKKDADRAAGRAVRSGTKCLRGSVRGARLCSGRAGQKRQGSRRARRRRRFASGSAANSSRSRSHARERPTV